jgi:cellulose synthase/poly-beta-1,6-N-acetylglucosamine synthase-like glycosyltransferase
MLTESPILRSRKEKPDDSRSRKYARIFFVLNIGYLATMWLLTEFYTIPPIELLLSWFFITLVMILILGFVDRRAARMVLEDLSRNP